MSEAQQYTPFNAMTDIIAAPSKALDEVKSRRNWMWWPIAIIILLPVSVFIFYFTWVDFDWMVDESVRMATANAPDADTAAAIAQGIRGYMTPTTQILGTAIAIPIMTLLIFAIQSGYLHLVNKVRGTAPELGFGDWFSFSAWTAFVGIFTSIAMLVAILMADGNQVSQYEINVLSLQNLVIHADESSGWFMWGNSLALTNFWMLFLMTLGLKRWTGAGTGTAAVIACAPWVLIFGIWALFI